MKLFLIKINLFLTVAYNCPIIYIGAHYKINYLVIFSIISLIAFIHLFILNIFVNSTISLDRKKINLLFISSSNFFLFSSFVSFLLYTNVAINFVVPLLFFISTWIYFINEIRKIITNKTLFIYEIKNINNFFYKLIYDCDYNYFSKINFFIIPLLSSIIFLYKFYDTFFIYYLTTLSFLLLSVARIINHYYKSFKKNQLVKVRTTIKEYEPNFIIYFSGNKQTTFQLNLWLDVFKQINKNFIIILREPHHYKKLKNTKIPVLFIHDIKELENISSIQSIKGALYLSNVGKNIHLIRHNYLQHIFIGHGDSDKSSSANNIMKMYDFMFVAGEAHIDRMKNNNIEVPKNYFKKIGRPQLELIKNNKSSYTKNNSSINILYAPTWEGYFSNSSYSSLHTINDTIKNMTNNDVDNINLYFNPHPHTGVVDKKMIKIIDTLYKASNSKRNMTLYNYLNSIDIIITDISGVLSEALFFDIPIILYKPKFIKDIKKECPISECAYIIDDKSDIVNLIEKIKTDDYLLEKRNAMKEYVMGGEKSSIARFSKALEEL